MTPQRIVSLVILSALCAGPAAAKKGGPAPKHSTGNSTLVVDGKSYAVNRAECLYSRRLAPGEKLDNVKEFFHAGVGANIWDARIDLTYDAGNGRKLWFSVELYSKFRSYAIDSTRERNTPGTAARGDYGITTSGHTGPFLFCPGIKGALTITDLTADHVKGSFAFTCFEYMKEAEPPHEVRGTFEIPLTMGAAHSPEGSPAASPSP
jgi:hypothetical protein